jgi:hypothetical protein
MTDKILVGGWVVSVTTQCGRERFAEFYEVAEAAPIGAEHAVSMHIDAMDEKIEAVERMPRAVLDRLGLRPGEVRKRA